MPPCPFCSPAQTLLAESPHALAIADAFPVARGHALIIPRRHVGSVFDLSEPELTSFFALVGKVRAQLQAELRPDAFTVGINDGAAAGQTVEHAHCHLIPRWRGDAADPRGGIRLLFPERARYWND